jgi:ATP/maltotriose-dependent transcriptional regulator MalT
LYGNQDLLNGNPDEPLTLDQALSAGRASLSQGLWDEAERHLALAARLDPSSAEAHELLAVTRRWQNKEVPTFEAEERAYHLYRRRGDRHGAARMAMYLAEDALEFRGQPAVTHGWMQRAGRLLEGLDPSAEHAWLNVWMGHLSLMLDNDAKAGRNMAMRGVELAREVGEIDAEMVGMAIAGLALVCEGRVGEGLKLLDEAAAVAVSGEMSDRNAMATTICYLVDACDRIRDFDRAAQWCARAKELGEMWRFSGLLTVCRPHYAVVLMWRGDWQEAEAQLQAANREVMAFRPPMAVEGIVRLAELRWRQGRWDEAEKLFDQVRSEGLSQLGRAELALSKSKPAEAVDLAERFLRRMPTEDRIERASGLELMVRALVACNRPSDAVPHATELREIAEMVGTQPLLGAAAVAEGLLAAALEDSEAARRSLEDAVDYFERHSAPFEAARARLELARVLQGSGRREPALREAEAAARALQQMGAEKEAQRAQALLGVISPGSAAAAGTRNSAGLTPREVEVLQLIATGKSNQEIAEDLVLSIRTVERHIAGIYQKIGVEGRSARAAVTAYALKHGV